MTTAQQVEAIEARGLSIVDGDYLAMLNRIANSDDELQAAFAVDKIEAWYNEA